MLVSKRQRQDWNQALESHTPGLPAPPPEFRDAGLHAAQAGCGEVHDQTQFPHLADVAGAVATPGTTDPETARPVPCLVASAMMDQLKQLLLVYVTGHRITALNSEKRL